jgi:hypothetical protein
MQNETIADSGLTAIDDRRLSADYGLTAGELRGIYGTRIQDGPTWNE